MTQQQINKEIAKYEEENGLKLSFDQHNVFSIGLYHGYNLGYNTRDGEELANRQQAANEWLGFRKHRA